MAFDPLDPNQNEYVTARMQRRLTANAAPRVDDQALGPGVDPYANDFVGQSVRSHAQNFGASFPAIESLGRKLVGDEAGADAAAQESLRMQQRAKEIGPAVQDFDQVKDVGSGLQFAAHSAIGLVPDIAMSLTGAGVGAVAARNVGVGMARRGIISAATKATSAERFGAMRIAARAAREAPGATDDGVRTAMLAARQQADRGVREAVDAGRRVAGLRTSIAQAQIDRMEKFGQMLGATAGQFPGMNRENAELLADDDTDQTDAAKLLLGTTAASAIGALPIDRFLSRFGGSQAVKEASQRFLPRVAKEAAVQGLAEGGAEVAQTVTQRLGHKWVNDNIEMLGPEAFNQYIAAFVGGALAGGALGGGAEFGRATGDALGSMQIDPRLKDAMGGLRERIRAGIASTADRVAAMRKAKPVADGETKTEGEDGGFSINPESIKATARDIAEGAGKFAGAAAEKFKDLRERFVKYDDIDGMTDETISRAFSEYVMGEDADGNPVAPFSKSTPRTYANQQAVQQLGLRTPLQRVLAAHLDENKHGALWVNPKVAQRMFAAADKWFTDRDNMTDADNKAFDELAEIMPAEVALWREVPRDFGDMLRDARRLEGKGDRKQRDAARAARTEGGMAPDTNLRAAPMGPTDAQGEADRYERMVSDTLNAHREGRADAPQRLREFRETVLGGPEDAAADGISGGNQSRVVKENRSTPASINFFKRVTESPGYVMMADTFDVRGQKHRKAVDLGSLASWKQGLNGEGMSYKDALFDGLTDLHLAGVKLDVDSIKPGPVYKRSGGREVLDADGNKIRMFTLTQNDVDDLKSRKEAWNALYARIVPTERATDNAAPGATTLSADTQRDGVAELSEQRLTNQRPMIDPQGDRGEPAPRVRTEPSGIQTQGTKQGQNLNLPGDEVIVTRGKDRVGDDRPLQQGEADTRAIAHELPPQGQGDAVGSEYGSTQQTVADVTFADGYKRIVAQALKASQTGRRSQYQADRKTVDEARAADGFDVALAPGAKPNNEPVRVLSKTGKKRGANTRQDSLTEAEGPLVDAGIKIGLHELQKGKTLDGRMLPRLIADERRALESGDVELALRYFEAARRGDLDPAPRARPVAEDKNRPAKKEDRDRDVGPGHSATLSRIKTAIAKAINRANPGKRPVEAKYLSMPRVIEFLRKAKAATQDKMVARYLQRVREGNKEAVAKGNELLTEGQKVSVLQHRALEIAREEARFLREDHPLRKMFAAEARVLGETDDNVAQAKSDNVDTSAVDPAKREAALKKIDEQKSAKPVVREKIKVKEVPVANGRELLQKPLARAMEKALVKTTPIDKRVGPEWTESRGSDPRTLPQNKNATAMEKLAALGTLRLRFEGKEQKKTAKAFLAGLARGGGLNAKDFRRHGVDPAEMRSGNKGVIPGLWRAGDSGMTLSELREALQQSGMLPADPDDGPPVVQDDDALDMVMAALRGEDVYAYSDGDKYVAADKRRAEEEGDTVSAAPVDVVAGVATKKTKAADKDAPHDYARETAMLKAILKDLGIASNIEVVAHKGREGGTYDFVTRKIAINPALRGPVRAEVLMHELGHHIVFQTAFGHMDAKVLNKRITDGMKQGRMPDEIAFDVLRENDPKLYKALSEDFEAWLADRRADQDGFIDIKDSAAPLHRMSMAGNGRRLQDLHEWLADNIARALTTQKRPVSTIEQFFGKIATALRSAWRKLTKNERSKFKPAKSVDAWVRQMYKAADARAALGMPVSAAGAKAGQVAAVHAAIEGGTVEGPAPTQREKKSVPSPNAPVAKDSPMVVAGPVQRAPANKAPVGIIAMRRFVRDRLTPDERLLIERALSTGAADRRLREIYRSTPAVIKALDSQSEGLETRIALGYFAWVRGELRVGPQGRSVLAGLSDDLSKILGVVGSGQQVDQIFKDIETGALERIRARGAVYDSRARTRRDQNLGKMDIAVEKLGNVLKKISEPWNRFIEGKGAIMRDMGIPAMRKLDAMLHQRGASTDENRGLNNDVVHRTALFLQRASKALDGLTQKEQHRVMRALQMQKSNDDPIAGSKKVFKAVADIRKLMDEAHDYITLRGGIGIPKVEDFFPVVLDIRNDAAKAKLHKLLSQPHFAQAIADQGTTVDDLVEYAARDADFGTATTGHGAPNFSSLNKRTMQFVYEKGTAQDIAMFASLQAKDPAEVFSRYFEPMVKRVEYAHRFGDDGAGLESLLAAAKAQGATDAQVKYAQGAVEAALGTYGAQGSPVLKAIAPALAERLKGRKSQSVIDGIQAYQNVRLLPLATLSSLVDPMGIAIRSGGDFKVAWTGFRAGIRALTNKATRAELHEMLAVLGASEDLAGAHALHTGFGGSQSPAARRANDFIFRANGLSQWTQATRLMALESAHAFLIKHARSGTEQSKRYLAELGLTRTDIGIEWRIAGNTKVPRVRLEDETKPLTAAQRTRNERLKKALLRFVDEAILRPNPQQMPLWHSDPYMGLVTQYKSFAYAIFDQIVHRIIHEMKHGNNRVLLPALAYVPLALIAELIREVIQHGPEGNPNREDWGPAEYIANAAEKTSLAGPRYGFYVDAAQDIGAGRLPGSSQIGPTLGQARDTFKALSGERDLGKTFEETLPLSPLWKAWNDDGVADNIPIVAAYNFVNGDEA